MELVTIFGRGFHSC